VAASFFAVPFSARSQSNTPRGGRLLDLPTGSRALFQHWRQAPNNGLIKVTSGKATGVRGERPLRVSIGQPVSMASSCPTSDTTLQCEFQASPNGMSRRANGHGTECCGNAPVGRPTNQGTSHSAAGHTPVEGRISAMSIRAAPRIRSATAGDQLHPDGSSRNREIGHRRRRASVPYPRCNCKYSEYPNAVHSHPHRRSTLEYHVPARPFRSRELTFS
jgi:hypothetical protein